MKQSVWDEENSEFKPALLCINFYLVLHPAGGEG